MVISCTVLWNNVSIRTFALVDTGATGFAFIAKDFVRLHSLPLQALKDPRIIEIIDRRPIDSGAVTHIVRLGLNIHGHEEEVPFFVTSLEHYPLVLGIPWMQLHDVAILFSSNSLTFGSQYCQTHCSPHPATAVVAEGISIPLSERLAGLINNIAMISTVVMKLLVRKAKPILLSLYKINQVIKAETMNAEWRKQIPTEYHDFLHLFDEKLV